MQIMWHGKSIVGYRYRYRYDKSSTFSTQTHHYQAKIVSGKRDDRDERSCQHSIRAAVTVHQSVSLSLNLRPHLQVYMSAVTPITVALANYEKSSNLT